MIHAKILALLARDQAHYQVHEHPPVRTIEEAQVIAPQLMTNLIKTIAFALAPSQQAILAAVPCFAQVDYKRLSELIGCNRKALRLMAAAQVEAELGVEVGGLGPFAVSTSITVVIERTIMDWPYVRSGAGLRTRTLELSPAALVHASAAVVGPITKATGAGD